MMHQHFKHVTEFAAGVANIYNNKLFQAGHRICLAQSHNPIYDNRPVNGDPGI